MKNLWDWLKLINFAVELVNVVLTKNEKKRNETRDY